MARNRHNGVRVGPKFGEGQGVAMSMGPIEQNQPGLGTNPSGADEAFNDALRGKPPEAAPARAAAAPQQTTMPSADAPAAATTAATTATVANAANSSGRPRIISDMDPPPGERPSSAGILAGASPEADGSFLVANTPFSSGSSRLGANWVGDPASGRQVLMFTQNGGSKDGWTGVEIAPSRVHYYPPGTTRGQVSDMLRNPDSNVADTTYRMGGSTPPRRAATTAPTP